MFTDINEKAPPWILKALDALSGVTQLAYAELKDDDSMPSCFGAISPDPKADDGFAWGLLHMPDELEKYQAYEYFRRGLAALMRSPGDRTILGGFSITEGWELDTETKKRTGREVLIISIETPQGWRASKMFHLKRESGAVSLETEIVQVGFHFSGEQDGKMQGMFSQTELSVQ